MIRLVDIVLSAVFIVLVLPLWVIVITILRLTGEGEVFYRQSRVGRQGKSFNILKFATMLKNSPSMGTGEVTMHNDPRVLPVGHVLRKTKINELPQLLNVFMGDMSIAGPRPQTQRCFDAFPEEAQQEIAKIRPGLSGLGAIIFRGEDKILKQVDDPVIFYDDVIMPYKGEVETWHVHHYNLKNYFLVIVVTIWIILFPKSKVAWKAFKGLPQPPAKLASLL